MEPSDRSSDLRVDETAGAERRPGSAGVVVRGGGWYLLGQSAPLIVAVVLTPYVVHGLGVERYGLFALATAVTTFIGSFDGGIRASAQRFLAVYAGREDDARSTRLVITLTLLVGGLGAVLVTVLVLAGSTLLSLIGIPRELVPEGAFLLVALAVSVSLGMLQGLYTAVLNAHHRYALINISRIIAYALYAVAVLYAVHSGQGLRGIALALVGQALLSTCVLVPTAARYLGRAHVGLLSRQELREFLRYSLRVQVTGLAGLVNLQADMLIVGAFAPLAAVGYYSVGATFASQLRALPTNALSPVHALLGRAFGGAEADARADFERLQRFWVIGSTGLMSVGIGAAWFGILAWLGDGYQLSAFVAVVLLAGHVVNLWTAVLTLWLGVVGRPELEARYGIAGMLLNVVLTLALAVPFGVPGVVVATMVAQVLGSLYLRRLVRRRLPGGARSFLLDVPVVPALAALTLTVAVEYVARPLCPDGPLGLLVCGMLAVPGLACFALLALGPRRSLGLLRQGADRFRSRRSAGSREDRSNDPGLATVTGP
jgi:O-antigen/teichoic acid export membrane protein